MVFYGGWDGWDYYRTYRSTGDEFTYRNYKGEINKTSGYGHNFNVVTNNEGLDFGDEVKAINSDYYAYLGAIRQFCNPKVKEINILACPGVELVNTPMLCNSVIDMVENERADCIYCMSFVDKPLGAGDSQDEMYTPDEIVNLVEDSGVDSSYTTVFYPWERYYDSDNSQYIWLPTVRDQVKDLAYTDNIAESWWAAVGYTRGGLDSSAAGPRRKLKLAEQDILYTNRINFVNTFSGESDKLWGDKNLQVKDSQLNRTSTRRLLLRIKKMLSNACIGMLFDPADSSQAKDLDSACRSVMQQVKDKRGVTWFDVNVDNSAELIDQYKMNATIYFKRANNLEQIEFTSVLTPNGLQF